MDERPDRLGRRIAIAETRMSDWVGSVLARAPWLASIRTKIFFGCLVLTLVTIVVGIVSQAVQYSLSDKALGIYDNAFTSMSYLRSAQSIVSNVSRPGAARDDGNVVRIDQLQSALDALDVARERAMSPRGEDLARQLQSAVTALQAGLITGAAPIADAQFTAVARLFDVAVQVYSGDGFRLRRSIEALVEKAKVYTYAAVLASVAMALAITLLLSRAIVPSLRNAVRIATAIAAGQRDNAIDRHGSSETGALLRALATMQDSIAEKIACIETLMAQQASSHAAEIASQHARFEAALNNMTLGLCMFDPGGALLVHNRRFVEMFVDNASASTDVREVLMRLGLGGQGAPGERGLLARTSTRALDDGRTIAVSESPMSGGGRVVTYEDVTERQRAEARLSHMARHDALTGLPNRVLFREQVERGLAQGRGEGDVLSLLCLDLDRFKTVNDTLGHPIGDALLREAAARLLNATEGADIVVRLGGDEFAVVQRSSRRVEDARLLAIRLIGALSLPFDIDGHRISIGVSIGIVETMDASDTPDSLLKNADLALYLAKADGRSTYRFFERTMDEQIQAKRRLELDLRTAIDERQFELFYQPLLSTAGGAVVAFEALLRWHHPERGLVCPAEFIPLAEETGLIVELGLWVMNQACRDATHWPDDVKVAINLSPLQFRGADLVGTVVAALRQSGLSGTRLELEITESVMLQDNDVVLSMLHDLRALGVCISMDDFGTGYSSLSYLCRFPFDKIKIDRGFVSNMTMGSDALAVVRAIVNLGRSLRMNVVAEGVETNEQMDLLCEAGCQEVQGYLFSRPQPADAAKALIERFAVARAA